MMWRFVLLTLLVVASMHAAFSGELNPPIPRPDRPAADELYLRQIHQEWNNDVVVTSNPDGSVRCKSVGDHLLYNNGGSWKQCFCTVLPNTWRCDASALTAP